MNTADIIAVISALIALASCATAIYQASEASKSAEKANGYASRANEIEARATAFAAGEAENSLREHIRTTNYRLHDISEDLENVVLGRNFNELSQSEANLAKQKKLRMKAALEEVLNAYENACGKYLDDKVDRERFQKNYNSEIRNLIEGDKKHIYAEQLGTSAHSSKFKAIWKVYLAWNDLENKPPSR